MDFRNAYKVAREFMAEQRGQSGLVGVVVSFILAFYVLSSTYTPLETAATTLNTSLAASTLTNVPQLGTLPGVAVLLFILVVIFGLILSATRGSGIE